MKLSVDGVRSRIQKYYLRHWKSMKWGSFRRLQPVSSIFGFERGQPVDRYYIEKFLDICRTDIRGRVLEIGGSEYIRKFGDERVCQKDVLHVEPASEDVTIIGDLESGKGVPESSFDCIILTQTFQVIYDFRSALSHCYNALKTNGVLLCTFPGISQISKFDMDRWGDYWRFTQASAKRLYGEFFGEKNISVQAFGNVLVACAFLHGLSSEELTRKELDYIDPNYPILLAVRACKSD